MAMVTTPRRRRSRTVRPATGPEARPAAGNEATERLQKALARAGLGSRRACEDLIRDGRVTVNGRVAELGERIDPGRDRVEVDGGRIPLNPDLRYFVLHKPRGVVTTARDPQRRPDVTSFFPPGPRLFPVGRLDRDTEGVLLVTNDGELANRVMHPRYGVEKEYLAEVDGVPGRRHVAQLLRGVTLEDGMARATGARPVQALGGRGAIRVVINEGRKREVRRMLGAVGLPVRRLVRTRVGPVRLGRLRPGQLRELEPEEIRALWRT
jgi:23S rRNA pseudouridine2605 synthase